MEENKLCDVCWKRPATRFLTIIFDGPEVTQKLCDECAVVAAHSQSIPELTAMQNDVCALAHELTHSLKTARCRYCGEKARTMQNHAGDFVPGKWQTIYLCFNCGTEYIRSYTDALAKLPEGLSDEGAREAISRLRYDTDRHMFHWKRATGREDRDG
jgi:DNA-directed RNA polymerase subunit RPC12/RpoP